MSLLICQGFLLVAWTTEIYVLAVQKVGHPALNPLLPNIISFLASEAAVSTYEFVEEGLGLPIAVGFVCLFSVAVGIFEQRPKCHGGVSHGAMRTPRANPYSLCSGLWGG